MSERTAGWFRALDVVGSLSAVCILVTIVNSVLYAGFLDLEGPTRFRIEFLTGAANPTMLAVLIVASVALLAHAAAGGAPMRSARLVGVAAAALAVLFLAIFLNEVTWTKGGVLFAGRIAVTLYDAGNLGVTLAALYLVRASRQRAAVAEIN